MLYPPPRLDCVVLPLTVELVKEELGEVLAVPLDQVVGDEEGSTLEDEGQDISKKAIGLGIDVKVRLTLKPKRTFLIG